MRLNKRIKDDRGMTLIEMLVSMTLGLIVIGVATEAMIMLMKSEQTTRDRTIMIQQAQQAMQQIQRQVRSGNVLYPDTSGGQLKIYTQANGAQHCVKWRYDAATSELRTISWVPGNTSDNSGERVVADHLVLPADNEPFEVRQGAPYGGRLLDVDLYVALGAQGERDERVRLAVAGRNTTYGYGDGVCDTEP